MMRIIRTFQNKNLDEQQRTAGRRYLKVWGIFFWAVALFCGVGQLAGFIPFSLADNFVRIISVSGI
jgi:hypothetical protein